MLRNQDWFGRIRDTGLDRHGLNDDTAAWTVWKTGLMTGGRDGLFVDGRVSVALWGG